MLFNSYTFIFVFLPVVLAIYAVLRRHPERAWTITWLVSASLFYYAWWKPQFLLLLLFSISVNAVFGKVLCDGRLSRAQSRTVLTFGIVFNLLLLGYFKYAGFLVGNLNAVIGTGFAIPQIVLPIGISFITFQKIAFLVDAHRGLVRKFSIRNYALFVTFFPQLIAGPIVHHSEMIPQFEKRPFPDVFRADIAVGLAIFCVGLFKKVIVADTCAVYADAGYGILKAGGSLDPASAWIAVLAFSFQLYYDFSGYSDMAVGLARLFGIRLPVNFHSPYKATGIVDFWRRWHMTLSRFLRDYLYIPLGGNRRGNLRRNINVAVVMLLGGLWHGANWTFVIWGGIHGAMLIANQGWSRMAVSRLSVLRTRRARITSVLATFIAVTLAWIPFRAENINQAHGMLAALFPDPVAAIRSFLRFLKFQIRATTHIETWFFPRELWPSTLPPDFLATYIPAGLVLLGVALGTFALPNTNQLFSRFEPVLGLTESELRHRFAISRLDWRIAVAVSAALVLSVLQLSRVSPFLYYQF